MLRSPAVARTDRPVPWRSAIEAWRRIPVAPKLVGLAALKLALLVVFLMISNQGVGERFAGLWAADLVVCWQKGSYAQEDEATSRRAAVQRPAPAPWTPTQLFIARAALHRIR
jgi:hypothetical protein